MNVNFNGFGEQVLTFIADDTITAPGAPVRVSADGTVTKCADNENFCGVCVGLRDGYAAVQMSGYVKMPANAKIETGYRKLAANSKGEIVVAASGRELLVVDATAKEVGFIL